MNVEMFDSFSIMTIFALVALSMLLSCEIGYQLGKHFQTQLDKDAPNSLGPMVGGLLGMLAFVLAFTFSIASSQHSDRKQNVLDETNAVGTAYLRADLLAMPQRKKVKHLLREYVDLRLQAVEAIQSEGSKSTLLAAALKRSITIHQLLWAETSTAAIKAPSFNTSLMVEAVNNVIAMHNTRVTAGLHYRIPSSVWIAVIAICFLTMITMGTQIGLTGHRRLVAVIPLSMAFSALLVVAVDLNHPQKGLITVGQQSMLSLQKTMTNDIN